MWENWQGDTFHAYGSRNHIMFGSQSDWYFKVLAGLNMAPGTVGWSNIQINPDVNGLLKTDLTSVSSSIYTHRGTIDSSWRRNTGGLCDTAQENAAIHLQCLSGTIQKIDFASYGTPNGNCGNFQIDQSCNAKNSIDIITKACLGKSSCSVIASNTEFGSDPCPLVVKRLYVQASGCLYPAYTHRVTIPVNSVSDVFIPKLGQTSVIISESNQIVWQAGQFKPGVPGISSAVDLGTSIKFSVGSGSYGFEVTSQ